MDRKNITVTKGGKAPDNEKTPSKTVRVLGYIGTSILAIILVFAIMALVSTINGKGYGSDTSEDAVRNILTAINNSDEKAIKKTLYPYSKTFKEDKESLYSFAESTKDQITIHMNSGLNDFTETPWDLDLAKEEVKLSISDAKNTTAKISTTKTINGTTYNMLSVYDIGTYELSGKWYIHYIGETASFILNSDNIVSSDAAIGSNTLGYISIDREWTEIPVGVDESSKFVEISRYQHNRNEITMGRLNSVDDLQTVSEYLCSQFSSDKYLYLSEFDDSIDGIPATNIMMYNTEHQTYVYIWLFKPPMSGGLVHYICLECTDPYDTYNCIRSYKY